MQQIPSLFFIDLIFFYFMKCLFHILLFIALTFIKRQKKRAFSGSLIIGFDSVLLHSPPQSSRADPRILNAADLVLHP